MTQKEIADLQITVAKLELLVTGNGMDGLPKRLTNMEIKIGELCTKQEIMDALNQYKSGFTKLLIPIGISIGMALLALVL